AMILFFICYVFVYGGWQLTIKAKKISSVMHIPYKVLYAIVPVSGVMVVIARILKYIQMFTEKGGKQ
ncbi:MAG: TRAP transporter small permease subunit, partial [Candidatus Ventricola sp.]